MKKQINLERIKRLLTYNPETGIFTRLVSVKGRNAGDIAGSVSDRGYVNIIVDGVRLKGHRLAWAFVHGFYPEFEIDHKDRNRSNNAIDNLRPATRSQQIVNRDTSSRNTSGAKGVYMLPSGRWRARICKGRNYIHLGYFDSMAEAESVYKKAASELFGEFADVTI